ncbi:MAG: HAD family hydrolase [Candidatus Omnitrophica bacterium]|nr:HAD family hydrolase [Candidatus Omnitrophota bacterium]
MVDVGLEHHLIRNVKLCCFDKDGTLIDLYYYWSNMVNLRAEGICKYYDFDPEIDKKNLMLAMGVDVDQGRLLPSGPVGILPRNCVQKAAEKYILGKKRENAQEVCFGIFKEVDEISAGRLSMFIKPIAGAVSLLEKIKKNGGLIAVATTDRTDRAVLAMKILGVDSLIDSIVGADQVKESKPAPEMLKIISQELRVGLQETIMVGDAETDIRMGINAGCLASVGVYSGITEREVLEKLTKHIIPDVSHMRVLSQNRI